MVGSRTPFTAKKRAAFSGKSVPKSSTMPNAVEHRIGHHEQTLLRGRDLGNISEIAVDDQRTQRAARKLHVAEPCACG